MGPPASEPTGWSSAPTATMPVAPPRDLASGPGFPVSASVSSPFPASTCPATKIGLVLPVCTAHSTGADTNGAVLPLDSLSTSPFEMFSTLIVNLVAAGAPWATAPWASARAVTDRDTARASDMTFSCSGSRGEWRRGEVDVEAVAPDRDRVVLVEVGTSGNLVVLVPFVALELPQLEIARLGNGGVIRCVRGLDQVDADIGTVGRREVRQAQHPVAAAEIVHRRGALGLVRHRVELPGQDDRRHRGALAGDERFVDPLVHEQQLRAEQVPSRACQHDQTQNPATPFHPQSP